MRVWTLSRHSIPVVLCLAVSAASLSASEPQGAAGGGNKVILRVTTDNGTPVTDLKREEVTIRTDSKAREVKEVELVRVGGAAAPAAAAPAAPTPPASTLPPPFASNAAAAAPAGAPAGRQFLFIVDEDGIGAGREGPVRDALMQVVKAGAPSDAFGLLSLRLVGGANIAPTTDRKVITDALQKLAGTGSPSEPAGEMVCRAKRALLALNSAFNSATPGLSLVIVSPGMLANPAGMTTFRRASDDSQQADLCQIRSNDLDDARNAVALSPANAYVFYYPEGLAASSNLAAAQQGIENVAGLVNADLMRIAGQGDRSVARIMSETSSYYVVTLDDAPGPVRKVEARVSRDGVKTQARLASGRSSTPAAGAKPASAKDMLRVQTAYTDLPLRAIGFVSRQPTGNDLKLIALVESVDPARKITAASVGVIDDQKGVVKWQWTAQAAELGRTPIPAALAIPPGTYRVRVAATDASGAAGAVDFPLNANLADAGTLKLGDMMLGIAQGGFTPKLQFTATDTQAVGLFEIYGAAKGSKLTVSFSLSETESGPALGETPGSVQFGPGEAHTAFGGFGIETLQPGDYIMRATVSLDGKPVGSVTRTLRKLK